MDQPDPGPAQPDPLHEEPAPRPGLLPDLADAGSMVELADRVILGPGDRLTPPQVCAEAGVPEQLARELWLAMGFPHIPDDERSLGPRDVRALRLAAELAEGSLFPPERLRHQTRIMSQALSTVASSHAEVIESLVEVPGGVLEHGEVLADGGLLRTLDELLTYLYRRHLLAALERRLLAADSGVDVVPLHGVVGFADLTRFTSTVAELSEAELTALVDDFAGLAADMVASVGGRVVKLLGDEVMFSVETPARAAELALGLLEAAADLPELPQVHAGLALGPLLGHHGDLFGPTVNLASRLTDVARGGTILVNQALAQELADHGAYRLRDLHLRRVKGIGSLDASVLRRATP